LNKVSFERSSPFYDELRAEVEQYFRSRKKVATGDYRLYLKSVILLGSFAGLYIALLSIPPGWLAAVLAGVFGVVLALIGFNVMHDACHGSYSSRPWVNELMGYSMNLLGSNQFIWKIKHNRIHHTFTNVDGIDDDIIKVPVMRHCESQPWKPVHRFQHIYAFVLYALSTILWVLFTDNQKYFTKSISGTPIRQFPLREHVIFWVTKVFYIAIYMVIPAMVVGFWPWFIGYLIVNTTFGLTLSVVFQLAHAVPITTVENARDHSLELDKEWASHQVATTADFAMSSASANWFCGGLNFQVIHHLFPHVSHVHYKEIQPLVLAACKRHGIEYHSYETMGEAINAHIAHLKGLGEPEKVAFA